MKFDKTPLIGIIVIEPDLFEDRRGYFYEAFNLKKFRENGIDVNIVQSNYSKSEYGTIRGLHYQAGKFAQAKLCQVISGKVLDVVVDIRFNSPTFGGHYSIELNDENKKMIWIPEGFAHGFSVLSDQTVFSYMTAEFYNKESERIIRFDDPDLNIDWRVENPVVSDKDKSGKNLKEIEKDFIYKI